MWSVSDAVQYVGPEDLVQSLYVGHPGRVVDLGLLPGELAVSFVQGTSCGLRADKVAPLDEAEYLARGRRLVRGLHPLEDRSVPPYNQPGHEWPEGHEPSEA